MAPLSRLIAAEYKAALRDASVNLRDGIAHIVSRETSVIYPLCLQRLTMENYG